MGGWLHAHVTLDIGLLPSDRKYFSGRRPTMQERMMESQASFGDMISLLQ
jgi:hypothetical protein